MFQNRFHRTRRAALVLLCLSAVPPATAETPPRTRLSNDREGGLQLETAPPSDDRRQALEEWARLYRRAGDPARRAATDCFRETDDRPPAERRSDCESLARWIPALTEAGVLDAPHFAVRRHVHTGVSRLGAAVTACLTKRPTAARGHWEAARRAFADADRLLARLGT